MLNHMGDIGYIVPLTDHKLDTISNYMHVNSGLFGFSISSASDFLMGVDSWVEEVVTYL